MFKGKGVIERNRVSWVKSRWTAALAGLLAVGCALQMNTHNESFGPKVTNECDQPVVAEIGDSVAAAEREIRESPITMQPGWRSTIAYVVVDDVVPDRVFLMVGVDADSAAMLELETSDVRKAVVELVFDADCLTLTRQ